MGYVNVVDYSIKTFNLKKWTKKKTQIPDKYMEDYA